MRKILFTIAAALILAAPGAKAETAISLALDACGKLDAPLYHACLDKIPKCEAVLTRDVSDYWHKGMTFSIDGAGDDPGMIHSAACYPRRGLE